MSDSVTLLAWQAPLSIGFFRHRYWSGWPVISPGDLPESGIKPLSLMSPALAGMFFTTSTPGKPHISCTCSIYAWTVWKGKDRTLKDQLPRSVGAQMLLEINGEITPERMKRKSQSKNNTQLWMWLVIEVNFEAVKSNTA